MFDNKNVLNNFDEKKNCTSHPRHFDIFFMSKICILLFLSVVFLTSKAS